MQAPRINDIKDPKVRNAVIMAQDSWSKRQKPFSKAIIEAATFCKADVGKVTEHMLKIAEEKAKE